MSNEPENQKSKIDPHLVALVASETYGTRWRALLKNWEWEPLDGVRTLHEFRHAMSTSPGVAEFRTRRGVGPEMLRAVKRALAITPIETGHTPPTLAPWEDMGEPKGIQCVGATKSGTPLWLVPGPFKDHARTRDWYAAQASALRCSIVLGEMV